jgi:hypothetical protein
MKYLQNFENHKYPETGDYIVCKKAIRKEDYWTFISENIGKIVKNNGATSIIQYDTIPTIDVLNYGFYQAEEPLAPIIQNLNYKKLYNKYTNLTSVLNYRIEFCSKIKKNVEAYIEAKKYNL